MTSRIGILGGTFDPVHYGHLILGEQAREQLNLDRILFVPANIPWRKARADVSPAEARLEMLRAAISDNPGFEISDIEIQQGGPSYTADTLAGISADNPGAQLFLIIGADALQDLPNWRDPDRILELARLAVAARPGTPDDEALVEAEFPVVRITMPEIGITSTDIRNRARAGLSLRYLTPDSVIASIERLGLYR